MITPERIAAAYDFLREFPPFHRWGLPLASAVTFKVYREKNHHADYQRFDGVKHHFIRVSHHSVAQPITLLKLVAHEMVHLKQALAKTETPNTQHNAEFRQLAGRVCRHFGWDPKDFYF